MAHHHCETCAENGVTREGEDYNNGWMGERGAEYLCADCRDRRAEGAYERMLDAYYGSSSPQNDLERVQ